jgi:hypothetical protein
MAGREGVVIGANGAQGIGSGAMGDRQRNMVTTATEIHAVLAAFAVCNPVMVYTC